ncbi:Syntaxin-8 [Merluccius polli]|uniref:Syntaxin-8 n=1 Tax=Merluccius polli TaxID=89951 RepID=A0AA47N0H5_MERPO|nr:Syntaxin-8 [Merluccius polli]
MDPNLSESGNGGMLQNYDATCRLAQETAENIHERTRQQSAGGNPAKINMTLRASLQKLKQNISQLKESLLRASSSRRIMQSEADRRQNLVDDLVTREKLLNATFRGEVTEEPSRSTLMSGAGGAGSGRGAVNPWLVNESEETRGLSFGQIKEQQHSIMEAQDAGLDALAAVISRQKMMGREIGNELEEQNGTVLWYLRHSSQMEIKVVKPAVFPVKQSIGKPDSVQLRSCIWRG